VKISVVDEKDLTEFSNTNYSDKTADTAIIMPLNDRPVLAIEAIMSIINQTYKNWVLVCVGKPHTQTYQFLKYLRDPRIVHLGCDEPTLAKTTNIALKYVFSKTRIKFVTRCDDDDWLMNNKVQVCRNYLMTHPGTGLVHHAYHITDEYKRTLNVKIGCFDQEDLEEYSNIYDGTIMCRTKHVRGVYLDEELPGLPYYDWFIKLSRKGVRMKYINYNGYFYRQHGANNVRRVDIQEAYRVIREKNNINIKDHECDIIMCYTWLGRESGITSSVRHCSSLLKKKHKVKIHSSPTNHLYGLMLRAQLCRPKLIIIENMAASNESIIKLMNSISWECNVILREHGKAAFSKYFWDKFSEHDRVIQLSQAFNNLSVASVNKEYTDYLTQLYDTSILWLPNTFNKGLMKEAEKINDHVHISILCEIRPLKNMITQLCACQLLGKWLREEGRELEVHMLNSKGGDAFIQNIKRASNKLFFVPRFHNYMSFDENQRLVSRMSLCLQVSYTETMNYYALEHMMHGVPTITSQAIPFGEQCNIDNPAEIVAKAKEIISDSSWKQNKNVRFAAEAYVKTINEQFLKTVEELI